MTTMRVSQKYYGCSIVACAKLLIHVAFFAGSARPMTADQTAAKGLRAVKLVT
jgi:hypothetical protein